MTKTNYKYKNSSPFVKESRKGTCLALGVAFVGMLVSIAMYFVVVQREENLLRSEFNLRVQERVMAVQREAQSSLTTVSSLAAFCTAVHDASPEAFYVFTEPLLSEHVCLQAMGINSVVAAKNLLEFEAHKRAEGFTDYRVTEKRFSGELIPVRPRSEYVPVGIISPRMGNERALGFDIASESIRREAVVRAIKTLKPAATGPIDLVQEKEGQKGFLLIVPVPKKKVADGEFVVDKLAVGVFRVGNLVQFALKRLPDVGVDFDLSEKGLNGEPVVMYEHRTAMVGKKKSTLYKGRFQVSSSIEVGGRNWNVNAWPTPSLVKGFITQTPANVLICGALFTFVVFVYLLLLNDLNRRFQSSEELFRLLSENIHGVFWIMGPEAKEILYVSPSFKKLFGFSPEEAYENPRVFIKAIHPDDRKRVVESFNALSYGIDFHEEWRILLPSGKIRWLLSHGYPVIRDVGDVQHIVGLASDITAQRHAEIERDKLRVQIIDGDEDDFA